MRFKPTPIKNLRSVNGQERSFDGGSPQSIDGECICGACKDCRAALRAIDQEIVS